MTTWPKSLRRAIDFPARYGQIAQQAASGAYDPTPYWVTLGTFLNKPDAERFTQDFRFWRYCLRERPAGSSFEYLEKAYRLKTKIQRIEAGVWEVRLCAMPRVTMALRAAVAGG